MTQTPDTPRASGTAPGSWRGRRLAQSATLLVLASVISLVVADLFFRGYESRFLVEEIRFDDSVLDLERFGHNDEIGYIERERRPDELRILSFGDSFAVSPTIARYSYAAVLRRRLAERLPDRRIRVVNLGQAKTSFDDYIRAIRFWRSRVEFDGILVNLYMGNDFHESPPPSLGRLDRAPPILEESR